MNKFLKTVWHAVLVVVVLGLVVLGGMLENPDDYVLQNDADGVAFPHQ